MTPISFINETLTSSIDELSKIDLATHKGSIAPGSAVSLVGITLSSLALLAASYQLSKKPQCIFRDRSTPASVIALRIHMGLASMVFAGSILWLNSHDFLEAKD